MSKLSDLLSGQKVLEKVESPINGTLTVIKDLAWGTYVKGGGLTQSGGVARKVWERSLSEVRKSGIKPQKALILGLGAGGNAQIINEYWPQSRIDGVEIDPLMVNIGKKYFNLDDLPLEAFVEDAEEFLSDRKKDDKYDLVLVDMYVQDNVPKKFESREFVQNIRSLLSDKGVAVFNRLFYDEKRKLAQNIKDVLIEEFSEVTEVYPEANVMFICAK